MPDFQIVSQSVIFRNPNPGYAHVSGFFPHPMQVGENELLCVYNRGHAMYATDLAFAQSRSFDGGETWLEELFDCDFSRDDKPYSYHDPMLSRVGQSTLLIVAFRVDRTVPDAPLFNDKKGGLGPTQTVMFRSDDNGRSWSGPQVLGTHDDPVLSPTSPIIELSNGNWLLLFDHWHGFDNPGPYRPRTVGWFSSDEGKSWREEVSFAEVSSRNEGFWHGRFIRLQNDKLFGLFWSADMKSQETLPLHRIIGEADGRAWSTPEATNLPGQTNWPVDLGSDRIAAICTRRAGEARDTQDAPGFYVALSRDGGKTFDLENQVQVWDATGRDKLGIVSLDSYPRSHDTIAFGAPTAMRLDNDDLLVCFWCTEMSVTHVRAARLKLTQK